MDLNINSPAYYTGVYGIDDEIYWMCRELAQYVKSKEYNKCIKTVGIVPIIASEGEIKKGLWKESNHVSLKCGFASVSLQIDYKEYVEADINKKKSLIIDNILKSLKTIKRRAGIDYRMFEDDIRLFCINNRIVLK